MNRTPWFLHPVAVFAFSLLALGLSLFLYLYWYIEVREGLHTLARRFNISPGQVLTPQPWVVVLVLSILVGIILLGIFTIFVYNQKTLQLFRLQHNFINNFTHELKTPVTSLKLFLETFLKHDLPPEEQRKYIHYMINDVSRLSTHISRILNLAQLESNSYRGSFEQIDLVAAVNQCIQENNHLFSDCTITVHTPPEKQLWYTVDRQLFEMLIMNLLTNSKKYNSAERVEIDISFESRRRHFLIRFEDNGIGIPTRDTRRIFKKFYRPKHDVATMAKGSGLGLNLVQNIARIHQGRVTAENRPDGNGALFTVTLPRKPYHEPETE